MTNKLAAGLLCALGLAPALISHPASAQVLHEANVSLAMANTMALASLQACKANDITVAVVDRSGALRVLMRSDSANPHNADLARRKAYTARISHMTSLQFRDHTATPEFAGQRLIPDTIPLGGGVPITIGADVIGAIGATGSTSQEADEKCAMAGIDAVKGQLK